jgi:hypothetical protein
MYNSGSMVSSWYYVLPDDLHPYDLRQTSLQQQNLIGNGNTPPPLGGRLSRRKRFRK